MPTLDHLKITGVTFQALRRTCASTLNNLGIDGKLVADQLGHTLDVSQNVYTKTGIARQQEAITQLDKSFHAHSLLVVSRPRSFCGPNPATSGRTK